ncbi:hypothetical protein PVK06_020567 [Gossypium arboreum]|uniref:Uncharacterized protein n=1 Tax=Gossypium arboreum TaxID=29729 RepID=A0ABR0PMS8_GOSAR|nr:hypothetical protein PVK06_020567 [Gossypium arboreum]
MDVVCRPRDHVLHLVKNVRKLGDLRHKCAIDSSRQQTISITTRGTYFGAPTSPHTTPYVDVEVEPHVGIDVDVCTATDDDTDAYANASVDDDVDAWSGGYMMSIEDNATIDNEER